MAATRTFPASAKAASLEEIERARLCVDAGSLCGHRGSEVDDEPIDEKIGRLSRQLLRRVGPKS